MRVVAAMGTGTYDDESMKVVASLSTPGYDEPRRNATYPYVLASFAHRESQPDRLNKRLDRVRAVWIDSGAFTVWQGGGTIDLDAYITYLHALRANLPYPIVPINLDVIPGERGRKPTTRQANAALKQSERNADRIRDAGLPVMEVWHRGEPISHLLHLADRRRPGELLGIGGLVGLKQGQLQQVVDPVFVALRDRYGWDKLPPVHGLGIGNRDMLVRYPWWSADSTSWIAPGIFGRTIKRNGNTGRDPRARNRDMRYTECARYLRQWMRWNAEFTDLWEKRGVRFDTPPDLP